MSHRTCNDILERVLKEDRTGAFGRWSDAEAERKARVRERADDGNGTGGE